MNLEMSALVASGPGLSPWLLLVIGVVVAFLIYRGSRIGQGRSLGGQTKAQAKSQSIPADRQSKERTDADNRGKSVVDITELKRQGRVDEARDLLKERMRAGEKDSASRGQIPALAPPAVYRHLMIVLRKQKAYAEVVRVLEHMATLTESSPKYWGEPSKLPGLLAKARADAERQRLSPESDTRGEKSESSPQDSPSSDSRRQPIPRNPKRDNRVLAKGTSIPSQTVPPFKQVFASEGAMSDEQLRFFRDWEKAWERGTAIGVDGNISYLFSYTRKVLERPVPRIIPELQRLIEAYSGEDKFPSYCQMWLSDCYVFLKDFQSAIDVYPQLPITSRNRVMTDNLLSLKLHAGVRISGRDILTLRGPKVTKWGKEHLDQVEHYLDVIVSAFQNNREVDLLEEWKKSSGQHAYSVFRGTFSSSGVELQAYSFSQNPEVIGFVAEKTRDAENSVREEMGLPRVGEGWIAETQLYYELCRAFPNTEVIHHARPTWLGKQHLDVFMPEYAVAIEYQGAQHDQPVEYFGGLEAFEATRKRDHVKMRLCKAHYIYLMYVKEGYDLAEVIREVVAQRNTER